MTFPTLDRLEPRTLFASAFPNVNVSRTPGNHSEGTIVVDPTNGARLFTASNAPGTGMLGATSADGGATWATRTIAGEPALGEPLSPDGLAPACCDPSAAFDRFGNLYLTYARDTDRGVDVVRSTDGGATFSTVGRFSGDLDQPTVTAGPDSVWVTFKRGKGVAAAGAAAAGLGGPLIFGQPAMLPGSGRGNFGDIAVGPQGQVAVTYQQGLRIGVNVDPDGLGPARFGRRVLVAAVKVSGFDRIPGQGPRGIDAEAGLAYDRSATSGFGGRLYLMYTDEQPDGSDNTDIVLRYSADGGRTWSAPARVNSDSGLSSQFLPRMAVDDASGEIGFAWHDTRNDTGPATGSTDTNGVPNDDVEFFAARARPTAEGVLFGADQVVSEGASNAAASLNTIDLGDYTGLAFAGGTLRPFWADNSNSTGDNPDGRLGRLDMYTAAVPAAALPAPAALALGSIPGTFQATYLPPRNSSLGGRPDFRFRVTYRTPAGVDPASLDDGDIVVTGPNGFSAAARVLTVRGSRGGPLRARRTVTYSVAAPGGRWTSAHNGTYRVSLQPGAVRDAVGAAQAGGTIGAFAVRTGLPPAS